MTAPDLEITCQDGSVVRIWADDGRVEGLGDVTVVNRLPQLVAEASATVIRQFSEKMNTVPVRRLNDKTLVDIDGVVYMKGGTVLSAMGNG